MRTIVFIDYWNLQLSLQHEDAKAQNAKRTRQQPQVQY